MANEQYGSNNSPVREITTVAVGTVNGSADKAASGGGSDLEGKVTATQRKRNKKRGGQDISMSDPLKMHLIHDHEFDIITKRDNDYGLRDIFLGTALGGAFPAGVKIYDHYNDPSSLGSVDLLFIIFIIICLVLGFYIWITQRKQDSQAQALIDQIRSRKTKKINLDDLF